MGGVHHARVDVAGHGQVEQVGPVLAVVEGVGRGLVHRHRRSTCGRVAVITGVNGRGRKLHDVLLMRGNLRKGPAAKISERLESRIGMSQKAPCPGNGRGVGAKWQRTESPGHGNITPAWAQGLPANCGANA